MKELHDLIHKDVKMAKASHYKRCDIYSKLSKEIIDWHYEQRRGCIIYYYTSNGNDHKDLKNYALSLRLFLNPIPNFNDDFENDISNILYDSIIPRRVRGYLVGKIPKKLPDEIYASRIDADDISVSFGDNGVLHIKIGRFFGHCSNTTIFIKNPNIDGRYSPLFSIGKNRTIVHFPFGVNTINLSDKENKMKVIVKKDNEANTISIHSRNSVLFLLHDPLLPKCESKTGNTSQYDMSDMRHISFDVENNGYRYVAWNFLKILVNETGDKELIIQNQLYDPN